MSHSLLADLGKLRENLRLNLHKVKIENTVFRLFSEFTSGVLFVCAMLVTLTQVFGSDESKIRCILPPKEEIRSEALHQYCYIMSTYTVPKYYNSTVGQEVPHYGVGPHNPETDEEVRHLYYQWVPFFLFFQGILFAVPHLIWKTMEGGLLKKYCTLEIADNIQLKDRKLYSHDAINKQNIQRVGVFFERHIGHNHIYATFYIFCEILNFIVVVSMICLTDRFLGYEFSSYGHNVVNFLNQDPEDRTDPLNRVFPKVTKCDFRKIGPSGTIMRYDILCILPLNILFEKIYTFLWFWFIIVAIFGGLALIYRALCFVPLIRRRMIESKGNNSSDKYKISAVTDRLGYFDWFILKRISENLDSIRFITICEGIKDQFKNSHYAENIGMNSYMDKAEKDSLSKNLLDGSDEDLKKYDKPTLTNNDDFDIENEKAKSS